MFRLLEIARSCLNVPYKWGGENPVSGLDCSGFVCWIFKCAGLMKFHDPKLSAQALFDLHSKTGMQDKWVPGSLAFYGENVSKIDHVGFCLDFQYMIEAGGGDHTTLLVADAAAKNACVRLAPIKRTNLVAVVRPDYSTIGLT